MGLCGRKGKRGVPVPGFAGECDRDRACRTPPVPMAPASAAMSSPHSAAVAQAPIVVPGFDDCAVAVRRSSNAMVILASLKTPAHSPSSRIVTMIAEHSPLG